MTSRKPLIMNSSCSQTHDLEKVKGTEVIEAFDLSNAYYILGLWRANGLTVGCWNHNPQMHLLEGNFLGDQTGRVVGLADSHMGMSWSPHLNSMVRYSLSNGLSAFLDCHWVCSKVGQFSNPHTCSCE